MIKVKSFKKLKGDKKKYEITFVNNGKEYKRKFGASGMSDFTIHKDRERRERYISRHKKDLRTGDPMKPGYLSMYILWNKPSVSASLADYKRRLSVYNRTGKFPTSITGSKKLSFGAPIQFDETSMRFLNPDVQKLIQREVSASQIQKASRKFLSGKQKIMRILRELGKKRYTRNRESRFLEDLLLNYDITTKDGVEITKLAESSLVREDFKGKSFWWQLVKNGLEQMKDIYEGAETIGNLTENDLPRDELDNFAITEELLVELVNRGGVLFDLVELESMSAINYLIFDWDELDSNSFGKKYSVPDNVVNKKLYASIKNKIKKSIKGRRWGAYDSGRLVREYKSSGGKYSGSKGKTDLGRWYKEKWVDACAWPKKKSCGRQAKEKIAYCRPSVKVDSKTPKLVQSLTKKQVKSRCDRKKKKPMKRITKFGVSTPDVPVPYGDGSWVIHCSYEDHGAHSTIRYKPLSEKPGDYSYHYGVFNDGRIRYWSSGSAKMPAPRGMRELLKDHYERECLNKGLTKQDTFEFYISEPRGSNMFGAVSQERLDKMRKDLYKDLIKHSGSMSDKVQKSINKRCRGTFTRESCNVIFTDLVISIYFSLIKKYKQEPKNLSKMLERVKKYEKETGIKFEPTGIHISKTDVSSISEMMYLLQDHSFGTFKNPDIAFLVYKYLVELNLVI